MASEIPENLPEEDDLVPQDFHSYDRSRWLSFLEIENSFLTPWSYNPAENFGSVLGVKKYMQFENGSFFAYEEAEIKIWMIISTVHKVSEHVKKDMDKYRSTDLYKAYQIYQTVEQRLKKMIDDKNWNDVPKAIFICLDEAIPHLVEATSLCGREQYLSLIFHDLMEELRRESAIACKALEDERSRNSNGQATSSNQTREPRAESELKLMEIIMTEAKAEVQLFSVLAFAHAYSKLTKKVLEKHLRSEKLIQASKTYGALKDKLRRRLFEKKHGNNCQDAVSCLENSVKEMQGAWRSWFDHKEALKGIEQKLLHCTVMIDSVDELVASEHEKVLTFLERKELVETGNVAINFLKDSTEVPLPENIDGRADQNQGRLIHFPYIKTEQEAEKKILIIKSQVQQILKRIKDDMDGYWSEELEEAYKIYKRVERRLKTAIDDKGNDIHVQKAFVWLNNAVLELLEAPRLWGRGEYLSLIFVDLKEIRQKCARARKVVGLQRDRNSNSQSGSSNQRKEPIAESESKSTDIFLLTEAEAKVELFSVLASACAYSKLTKKLLEKHLQSDLLIQSNKMYEALENKLRRRLIEKKHGNHFQDAVSCFVESDKEMKCAKQLWHVHEGVVRCMSHKCLYYTIMIDSMDELVDDSNRSMDELRRIVASQKEKKLSFLEQKALVEAGEVAFNFLKERSEMVI